MATSHPRQCLICLQDCKQPVSLDCFHTFCLKCLLCSCPLCQRKVQLSSGGVDKLTTNVYIKSLFEVKGGETVPRGDGMLKKSIHVDTQLVGGSWVEDGRHQAVNKVNGISEKKKIQIYCPARISKPHNSVITPFHHLLINRPSNITIPRTITESFGGVSFEFVPFMNTTEKWGETLALSINLSKTESPFIVRQVEYDITLVNQKDKQFSTKQTGHGNIQTLTKLDVDLIQMYHACHRDFGFIVEYFEEQRIGTDVPVFELDITISVSNIRNIDFNLK